MVCTVGEEFLDKLGAKSELWQYFRLLKGPNGEAVDDGSAYCKFCCRKVLEKRIL